MNSIQPARSRILLVDDHPANLLAMEAVLEPLGHELVRAGSAEEALSQLLAGDFALILLDVQMPGLDGLGVARLVRERERTRDVPIVFVTAMERDEGQVLEAYAAGAVDYLIKPFQADVLRRKVNALLGLAGRDHRARWDEARAREQRLQAQLRTREERYRFLAQASARLAAALEVTDALRETVRLAVPCFADYASADLLRPDGTLERVAIAHPDPAREAQAWELARRHPPRADDPGGLARVLATGQPELTPEIEEPEPGQPAYGHPLLEVVRALGLRSSLVVPLCARGQTLGALSFVMAESGRRFDQADLELALDLASRAALTVDNARLLQEAREASRLKDEFLSTVSHELATPLTSVLGWARLLRTRDLDPAQRARAAEVIERNALSQKQLIDDLLDTARIQSGKLRVGHEPVELRGVAQAALEVVRPLASARGVLLEAALEADGRVAGDGERLLQVALNLLTNAIKFTPPGGKVRLALEREGGSARLSVSDTGEGIPPGLLPHVFERFRQGERNLAGERKGLGLGLAIVKHLVDAHRGAVEVRSEGPGRGATFTVVLPQLSEDMGRR